MNEGLKVIINKNAMLLSKLHIVVDKIKSSVLDFIESAEQVDLFNEKAITRITLLQNNRL